MRYEPIPKGKAFLLKISDGGSPPTFATVAGLRLTTASFVGGGARLSASGVFTGSAAEVRLRNEALAGTIEEYELSFDDGDKLRGRFLITRFDYAGDFSGERQYAISLESVGEVATV